jgi:predicted PhzF superfamily epimerase YddE/YHI9
VIEQGAEAGRPSLLTVDVPVEGRVKVTGSASEI